jgi:hypothetical protein
MQPRPTESKITTYRYYYFYQNFLPSYFNPENYDQTSLEAVIKLKGTWKWCYNAPQSFDDFIEKEGLGAIFGIPSLHKTKSKIWHCILEVILTLEELKQNPLYSYLVKKANDDLDRKDGEILKQIMNIENTSKLYLWRYPKMKTILNPQFIGLQQERAFLAGKILGKIDEEKPRLEETPQSQPNSVYTFYKNELCDFRPLSSLVFSFLHSRQRPTETENYLASSPTPDSPGGK